MKSKLIDVLLRDRVATTAQIDEALARQKNQGGTLDTVLLEMGIVTERELQVALEAATGLAYGTEAIIAAAEDKALKVYPEPLANKYHIVPIALKGRNLTVLTKYPVDMTLMDEVGFMLSLYLKPYVTCEFRIYHALEKYYHRTVPARYQALIQQCAQADAAPQTTPDTSEDAAAIAAAAAAPLPKVDPSIAPPGMLKTTMPDPTASAPVFAAPPPLAPTVAPEPEPPPPVEPTAEIAIEAPPEPGPPTAPTMQIPAVKIAAAEAQPQAPAVEPAAVPPPLIAEAHPAVPGTDGVPQHRDPAASLEALGPPQFTPLDDDALLHELGIEAPAAPPQPVRTTLELPSGGQPGTTKPRIPTPPEAVAFTPLALEAEAPGAPTAQDTTAAPKPDMAETAIADSEIEEVAEIAPEPPPGPPPVPPGGDTEAEDPAATGTGEDLGEPEILGVLEDQEGAPVIPVQEALQRLQGARTRDEIVDVAIDFVTRFFDVAALMIVQGESVSAWRCQGRDVDTAGFVQLKLPLDSPSVFHTVYESKSLYLGPVVESKAMAQFYWALSRKPPSNLICVPLAVNNRIIGFVYADRGQRAVTTDRVSALAVFAAGMSQALTELVRRKKYQRVIDDQVQHAVNEATAAKPAAPEDESTRAARWQRLREFADKLTSQPEAPAPASAANGGEPPSAGAQPVHEQVAAVMAAPIEVDPADITDVLDEVFAADSAQASVHEMDEMARRAAEAKAAQALPPPIPARAPPQPPKAPPPDDEASADVEGAVTSTVDIPALAGQGAAPATAGPEEAIKDAYARIMNRRDALNTREYTDLVAGGETTVRVLAPYFPGPLLLDAADQSTLEVTDPREHTVLIRLFTSIGQAAVPALLDIADDADERRRLYAAFTFAKLWAPQALLRLMDRVYDPSPRVRLVATDALMYYRDDPAFEMVRKQLLLDLNARDMERRRLACLSLGHFTETSAIPALIERLAAKDEDVRAAAHEALIEITKADFGTNVRRWKAWSEKHAKMPRVLWLIEGLRHDNESIRGAASDELRRLTGHFIPYLPDDPKRDREKAIKLWEEWWESDGRRRFGQIQRS